MNVTRIQISPEILYKIFGLGEKIVNDFQLIEDNIISSDTEDGGADHRYVLKNISTNEFFTGQYSDWDVDNTDFNEELDICDGNVDFNLNLQRVFPKEKTIIIYE